MSHEGHAADMPGTALARPRGGRRAAVAARLRVLALLGLGPGLIEGAALVAASERPEWGLAAAGVSLGLWMVIAVGLGLPFLLGALAPDARRNETEPPPGGGDRPGPLATATGLGLSLLPGLVGAVALTALLATRVAPGTRPYLGLALGAVLPALSALAAPTLVALAARVVPRRLQRPWLRFVFLVAVAAGAAPFVEDVDDRLLPLLGVLPAAGLAGLGGRTVRIAALVALVLAPALGAVALKRLEGAPTEHARAPSTAGLLYGAVLPVLEALSDDDGDGHGDAFGGDDCDDDDRAVHPGARDIPRNKKDDNCRGGDLVREYRRDRLAAAAPDVGAAGPPSFAPTIAGANGETPAVGGSDTTVDDTDEGADEGIPGTGSTATLAEPGRPHIVLLVVDSLRFDVFGPRKGLTPNIDRLAAAGTRFERAYAPSSATRFSITAMLAGRWMAHTRYEEKLNVYTLDPGVPLLQAQLRARGYRTGAIVPGVPHTQMPRLRKGFQEFNVIDSAETTRLRDHTTPTVVQRILKQIADAEERPAFVYAHLMDAHHPYRARAVRPGFKKAPGSRGDYESEIAQIDADLQVLFDALEPIRARRPVMVVVTADHGEGFGEHGTRYHARDLHQTSLHVPLVFHGPGVKPGHVVDTPVDLLDVGVTLAVAGGVELPGAFGSSLTHLLGGGVDATNRPMFGELRVWRLPYPHYASVLEWPHKLIVRMDTGQHWLYDLAADPGERVNLWAQSTPAAQRLDALLATWAEYGNGPAGRLLPEGLVEK
jgi:arylsulfatase A-like enzyme